MGFSSVIAGLFCAAALLLVVTAMPRNRHPPLSGHAAERARHRITRPSLTPFPPQPVYYYKTKWFTEPVDHFGFQNSDTFQMRYLINDTYWQRPSKSHTGGPIFFYTGNEGGIDLFAANTGFMWDIMEEFKAMVVFAEHRYYGLTMPYGNDAYANTTTLQYLTSEQALADYAVFLRVLKLEYNCVDCPIIAFGGSYGGMLAAWFRIKYPHVVAGAIASSAPIWQFTNLTGPDVYNHIVTRTFNNSGPNCANGILKSWDIMTQWAATPAGIQQLNKVFRVCPGQLQTAGDVQNLLFPWIYNAFSTMAMGDYPYPATFLGPMPGYPVKYACKYFKDATTPAEIVNAVYQASNVYYNFTGGISCANLSQADISTLGDAGGWAYQSCTEMVMPLGQYPGQDMFYSMPWNLAETIASCKQQYPGVVPRPDWVRIFYGGHEIREPTNIRFANGDLDPWSGGGVLKSLSPSLVAVKVEGGAHHLDLRGHNSKDPESVIKVRDGHKKAIRQWIEEAEASAFASINDSSSHCSHNKDDVRKAVLISVFVTAGILILIGFALSRVKKNGTNKTANGYSSM